MSDLHQLEQQLIDAKTLVATRQMAIRLAQNTEFKKLILDGFCLHDAARFVQESGDPALGAEERADALGMAQASGHLKRFLSSCVQMGAHAERTMPDLEAAIEEARGEGGDE
jgi:hypothetical protein